MYSREETRQKSLIEITSIHTQKQKILVLETHTSKKTKPSGSGRPRSRNFLKCANVMTCLNKVENYVHEKIFTQDQDGSWGNTIFTLSIVFQQLEKCTCQLCLFLDFQEGSQTVQILTLWQMCAQVLTLHRFLPSTVLIWNAICRKSAKGLEKQFYIFDSEFNQFSNSKSVTGISVLAISTGTARTFPNQYDR